MTFALADIAFDAQAMLASQYRQTAFYPTAMLAIESFELACLLADPRG